ncbi:CLUMA_CG000763, isoform A [Clunio marinus]|uniref:CLUMA_CG000763, isoform A n=1 Tax=Clunio marinus TaxID=568069 RepID=A0A1J1HHB1_9DIPT|nr:CLUMA_CG000763, isoform A [Clunio marinus]
MNLDFRSALLAHALACALQLGDDCVQTKAPTIYDKCYFIARNRHHHERNKRKSEIRKCEKMIQFRREKIKKTTC